MFPQISMLVVALAYVMQITAWTVPAPSFTGDGTFYDLGTEGQAGICGYESVTPIGVDSFKQLPFASGVDTFVALNSEQYAGASSCGQCLIYKGVGGGSGTTPIASSPQYGMTSNLCPEVR